MSSSEVTMNPELEECLRVVKRGCDELLVESEFVKKMARSHDTGQPLRIKLGLDPTAPDIHLGHTVVLNKLRQLQDLGHTVIFLIGDFTSM
ncbi:MAG: tyrosine--tRNA ligase, partial [Pusillimonas sp.]|nr:tyrosine--tRNA ligase [Pusillimonas sp.]